MSIVLRVNKGSALTYDEMDRNQSQFFYSSSLHTQNTILRLHYTGSSALNEPGGVDYGPRYVSIDLNPNEQEIVVPTVAGDNKQVQFNDNGVFGASSNFVFDKNINSMGIGTSNPSAKLDIYGENSRPAAINLYGYGVGPGDSPHAIIRFYEDQELIGRLGRINIDNSHIYVTNQKVLPGRNQYGKIIFSVKGSSGDGTQPIATVSNDDNQKRFGVGTTTPNRQITAVGDQGIGIGNTGNNNLHSYLQRIPNDLYIESTNGRPRLVPSLTDTPEGLLISSPDDANGGNVVININTDGNNTEGFNIIKSSNRSGLNPQFSTSTVLASFQASGKVGINTNYPPVVGLTVSGIVSGSGNAEFGGTLTAKTIADDATAYTDLSPVGVTSTGLVKKIGAVAAAIPVGGIIMWSGTTANIPSGWALCNGQNNTPDLRERFVVGAGGVNDTNPVDNNSGYGVGATGGNNEITLGSGQIPELTTTSTSKVLTGTVTRISETFNSVGTVTGIFSKATGFNSNLTPSSPDPNNAGKLSIDATHTHTVGSSSPNRVNIRPAYYALAFIMYVGT